MKKFNLMVSSALTSMSPAERAMGRLMRSPDAHPAPAAPAAPAVLQPTVVTVEDAEPAPEAVPAVPTRAQSIEDQYDQEYGQVAEPAPAAPEEPAPAEEEAPPAPEPEGVSEQQPIDDAEAARAAENQRREDEVAALRREIAELRGARQPEQEQRQQQESAEDPRPDPADFEFGEADSSYISTLARWEARQEFIELQQQSQRREEIAAMESGWKEAVTAPEIAELYPDFAQVVTEGAKNQSWDCSPVMTIVIKNSEVGPHVAYELASNAAESKRIAALSPMEQVLELGRMEGRHMERNAARGEAAPAPAPTPAAPSKAPAPPPVRSRGAGGQYASAQEAVHDRMLREFN